MPSTETKQPNQMNRMIHTTLLFYLYYKHAAALTTPQTEIYHTNIKLFFFLINHNLFIGYIRNLSANIAH